MRKITIAIISLFMVLSFTAMASAAESHNSTAGATVTIDSSNCPGPNLTFNPSPSTVMSVSTTATAFTIIAASSKTNKDTGIEYGLVSDTSVVYQKTQTTAGAVTPTTSANALPSGFKDKSGKTAPTS